MIIIKSEKEIEIMRTAAKVTAEVLVELENFIKPGMSTADIDKFVEDYIVGKGMYPTFKNLYGFPASACISVNEEIVHGIPSKDRILVEGDIVSVDVGSTYEGYVSDAARTYPVGKISKEAQKLIDVAKSSFFAGLEFCREGYRLSDVSHAIQVEVESNGFGVIRDYTGHGVGRNLHEDPKIPNYGKPGKGPRLQRGMTLAIEPMITQGSYETEVLLNDWTVVTLDGKLSAHYENTVLITDGEPELLTM
ncbi:MAG: type I methionyl aminopeptidase [Eubacteriales bacterium]|nr:type I methionyl aminopeptidase [Eubacteriales bacterium]MDY3333158.1 type I methionyl aminopeptidase [Gallibacter sp.]